MMSDCWGGAQKSDTRRGGGGSKMTPKNRTSFKDVLFVFSKARDLHDSLFGGRRMYIHNKYRQRIVFCWWDCIQGTPLIMRQLKYIYILHPRKSPNSEEILLECFVYLILFLAKDFDQKIQSIMAKKGRH